MITVAPLVGAWIEIPISRLKANLAPVSLPSWERGLKYVLLELTRWHSTVAPLVGAWIEICADHIKADQEESLPSWERGVKYST